jgi:hypothetical protein
MDRARFALALPDDPDLLGRLTTALAVQSDPPISLGRSGETVIAFESLTGEMMLRSRVMQALEVAAGPDWQSIARPVDQSRRAAGRCPGRAAPDRLGSRSQGSTRPSA